MIHFALIGRRAFTRAERIVIIPTTVWRWCENLQLFSAFRTFEQAQAVAVVLEELYFSPKRCSCVVTCEEESNG